MAPLLINIIANKQPNKKIIISNDANIPITPIGYI